MNKISKLSILLGIIVIVATFSVFLTGRTEFLPSTMIGFVFLLFSEVVFFGGIAFVEYLAQGTSKILTRVGIGLTIGLYAVVVFITSLVFINMRALSSRGFLIVQILLLVVEIIIVSVLAAFSKSEESKDAKVLKANAISENFESELMKIKEQAKDKVSINKLIEGIRYSDTSCVCDADIEIDEKIMRLNGIVGSNEQDEGSFGKAVKDIDFLIKKRNLQVKNMKQGGI